MVRKFRQGLRRQEPRKLARHAQQVAAGKIFAIAFDDEAKRIEIAAKIVDDDEWRKIEEGVYTGLSKPAPM